MSLTQPVSTWLEPTVCIGDVMHARTQPVRNQFRYPLFYLRLPLSKLSALNIPGLAINKTGLCQILNRDHGPQDGTPLLPWVRSILETRDLASLADDGEIVLQTMPRILGYTFNPVSFFFCYDASGLLRAVICEVSNTFGERHNYLVSHEDADPILPHQWLTARKVFHVSPFFPLTGHYRFRFGGTPSNPTAMIDYRSEEADCAANAEGVRGLRTWVRGSANALTGRSMTSALLHFPLMTFTVIARIHWQALRLWIKKVPFYTKPNATLKETSS